MQFTDPIASGLYLVREALRSPNYVAGSSGWTINADGSSEFNNVLIRGGLSTGPPTPYIDIPANGNNVNFYPSPLVNPIVLPGRIGSNTGALTTIDSPTDTVNVDLARLNLYPGTINANPATSSPLAQFFSTNVQASHLWAAQHSFGYGLDATTRTTTSTAYAGIAGQLTADTIVWPYSGKLLVCLWALTNNPTAGANTLMSFELRAGSLAGPIIYGVSDAGAVRNNSTGNQAGAGWQFVNLPAQTSSNIYGRALFRVSGGTGNYVQSQFGMIAIP